MKQGKRRAIFDRDGPNCVYCGAILTPTTFTLDHKTPLSKGGTDCYVNLTIACQICNTFRGNKEESDLSWMAARDKKCLRIRRAQSKQVKPYNPQLKEALEGIEND